MRRKIGIAVAGLAAAAAVLFGLLFTLGPIGGSAFGQGDPWDEMHAACQSGDQAAMVNAMRGIMTDEQTEAMQRHMGSMHADGMPQGMMGGGMMRGGSMTGGGMMGAGQQCHGH